MRQTLRRWVGSSAVQLVRQPCLEPHPTTICREDAPVCRVHQHHLLQQTWDLDRWGGHPRYWTGRVASMSAKSISEDGRSQHLHQNNGHWESAPLGQRRFHTISSKAVLMLRQTSALSTILSQREWTCTATHRLRDWADHDLVHISDDICILPQSGLQVLPRRHAPW